MKPSPGKKEGGKLDFFTSANADIWQLLKENNIPISEIAQKYKCSEQAFIKALRVNLPTSTREDVLKTIRSIAARKRG